MKLPSRCLALIVCLSTASAFAQSNGRYPSPTQLSWNAAGTQITVWENGVRRLTTIDVAKGEIVNRQPAPAILSGADVRFAIAPNQKWTAVIDVWQPELRLVAGNLADNGNGSGEVRRIGIDAHPQGVAFTPDSQRVIVACDTPGFAPRTVAIIDVASGEVRRLEIPESSGVRGVAVDPRGRYALVTHLRPKSNLPSTQIDQSWVFMNVLGYIPLDAPPAKEDTAAKGARVANVVSLPLDLRTQGFANPDGVAISPDGNLAAVAHAGADAVSLIYLPNFLDFAKSKKLLAAMSNDSKASSSYLSDDFRTTRRYVKQRISVGATPRGLAWSPDGKWLAVAEELGDSISLIDATAGRVIRTVRLGDEAADLARQGEKLFNSGRLSFSGQFSCASCHPGGHTDGLNWDLPADGFGNFQNTKTLLGVSATTPYGWLGTSGSLRERIGGTIRHLFQHEPDAEESTAVEAYLASLEYPESLPRRVDPASAPAQRGQALFRGAAGCVDCHTGTKYMDGATHDIGLGGSSRGAYDTPSLLRISESAPYLHDGRAATLEEIFTKHNTSKLHGNAGDLTPEQNADLVEFLKTL